MEFLLALVPSVGVLFLFWLAVRALVQADRRERAAQARYEAKGGSAPDVWAKDGSAKEGSAQNGPAEPGVTADKDAATVREGD